MLNQQVQTKKCAVNQLLIHDPLSRNRVPGGF